MALSSRPSTATPQQYYLRGPIETGQSIFFVADQQIGDRSYLSFLTVGADGNLIFDPRQPDTSSIPTFTVTPATTGNGLLLVRDTNSGLTSQNSVVRLGTPSPLVFTTDQVNPWSLLLAGVYYTAQTPTGTALGWPALIPQPSAITGMLPTLLQTTQVGDPQTTTITKVRPVPIRYYFVGDCSRGSNQLATAVNNEIVWYQGQVINQSMTRLTDCQAGFFYNYCPNQQLCSPTCAGPCQGMNEICEYSGTTQTLACVADNPPEPPTPWWQQPWFWWVAGGIGFLLLLFLIVIIVVVARR